MHATTFDTFVRRTAGLADRRSFLGGLSAALPVIVGLPLAAEAKKKHKRKKRNKDKKTCGPEKECRSFWLPQCADFPEIKNCKDKVKNCCEKACKSTEEADECADSIE
jgi:hypothetical protein